MSNFGVELEALVIEWLKRGDNPESMAEALREKATELSELSRTAT